MRTRLASLASRLLGTACLVISPVLSPGLLPDDLQPQPITEPPARVTALYENAADICGPLYGSGPNPDINFRIQILRQTLKHSATGRDLVKAARLADGKEAWLCFTDKKSKHATYHLGIGVITLNRNKTDDAIVADAVHELRHLYQDATRPTPHTLTEREDLVQLEYAEEADAEAVSSLVLWELRQARITAPWNHHNSHYSYRPVSICYAHISDAFQQAITQGKDTTHATAAAFRAWYRDPSLLAYYRRQALDNIEATTRQNRSSVIPDHGCSPLDNSATQDNLPSAALEHYAHNYIGTLPSYRTNYLGRAGGLKAVLSNPS